MNDKLNIVLIESTTRKLRQSIKVARLVEEVGKEFSDRIKITFVDINDFFPLPGEGNDPESRNSKWIEINTKSDGYFIVAPEYNHSFPGSLKMLLDNDIIPNYTHKAVAIAGVSSGQIGGARMIENLVPVLRYIGLVPIKLDLLFPYVQSLFDGSKENKVKLEEQKDRIRKAYQELIWMAEVLKSGRNS
jgi:NAD(P)H-dependent FMN reductase